jgi:hypothetical protein
MTFIPDKLALQAQQVPYFEDSQDRKIPGRGTEKTVRQLQTEIVNLLAQLGASSAHFIPGTYEGPTQRYGYRIEFWYGSIQGRIDCAALPMRHETDTRKDRALAQALFLLRDELQTALWAQVHKPGAVPLVPYLIGAGGQTVTEYLLQTQNIPQLGAGRQNGGNP